MYGALKKITDTNLDIGRFKKVGLVQFLLFDGNPGPGRGVGSLGSLLRLYGYTWEHYVSQCYGIKS